MSQDATPVSISTAKRVAFEVFDIVGATGESFQRFLDASVPSALTDR